MIFYLIHATILITASFFFYKAFLQKETFFQLNRWVLLGSMVLAFALPFVQIPADWSIRSNNDNLFALSAPVEEKSDPVEIPIVDAPVKKETTPVVSDFKKEETSIATEPVNQAAPMPVPAAAPITKSTPVIEKGWKISWIKLIQYAYLTGVIIFFLNFLIQLFILLYKRYTLPSIKDGQYRIIELSGDEAPYSFLNNIFINPENYDWETYNQILKHEKIHVRQKHSYDILLAELMVIVQWFNPFAWMHRKALTDNLEYITDMQMLHTGANRESYQMNLLRVAVPQYALHLTNNYNQSILKKRIFMMNTKKSSVRSSWKYLFLLPLFGFSVMSLNAIKTAEAKEQSIAEVMEMDSFDTEDQTTPTITPKRKQTKALTPRKEVVTAESIAAKYNLSKQRFASGHWDAEIKGKEVCFTFKGAQNGANGSWHKSACFEKNEFSPAFSESQTSFTLKRAAGTLSFKGKFSGNNGTGTYSFKEDDTFKAYLGHEGLMGEDEDFLFHCFFADINKEYISYLKKEGFKFDADNLEELGVFEITQKDLQAKHKKFSSVGYKTLEIDDIIALEIHDVNPDYIAEFKKLGLTDLSWEEIVSLSIHDVTPQFVKDLHNEGMDDLSYEEVVTFAIHDVDAEYIRTFRSMGFRDFTTDEIAAASIHDVTPEYIKSFENSGLGQMSMEEITSFAIHDVKAEDIKAFKAMGFRDMTYEDIVAATIHDVTPEYLEAIEKEGLSNMTIEEITAFAIHDIKPENIKEFKSMGFKDMSQEDIVAASIHGVTPEYLESFKAVGLEDLSMEEITGFAIHNIKAEDIKAFKSMGFRDMTHDDIMAASIHDVTPEYLKSFEAVGLGNLSMEEVTHFAIHDIDAEDIKEFKNMGFREMTPEDIVAASIHGVTPEYLKSFKKVGMGDMSMEEITHFAIHDIQPSYIQGFKKLGLKDLSTEDIVAAGIHDMSPDYVRSLRELGFKNESISDFVSAHIHNVTAEFIKKKRAEGKTGLSLEEYIGLKIHDGH